MADSLAVPRPKPLLYLCSPYTDPDQAVEAERWRRACQATAWLMQKGYPVFSPIAHSYDVALWSELPRAWEFWARQCLPMVERCDALLVLALEGWERSVGCRAEWGRAAELGKRIGMLWPAGAGWAMDEPEEWR